VKHVAAWVLALAACAGVVVARVLVGESKEPLTFAVAPAGRAHTRTVTRTHTVVVTVRAKPARTTARVRTVVEPAAPAPRPRSVTPKRSAPARRPATPRRRAPSSTQNAEGDAIPTRYGAVQVRLVLRGRRILDVVVLQHPDEVQRSRDIDADALPRLRAQVLAAQSAQVDGVAGATYTSQGYRQSVQSALDLA
jgi:uncharacterized protein with FMN-binding domain